MEKKTEQAQIVNYMWMRHVGLLDLVDLVEDQRLRRKIKTKILDVAHEVKDELSKENKEE